VNVDALWEIRLHTPRLELRLPTEDELVELFRVAEGGIHPPEEMPFLVPWTDDLRLDAFIEFHQGTWAAWRPEKWSLNLITFLDGQPIGSQGIEAEDFAAKREVVTGSWLGAPYQGRGLGTEQRAAVLELGFAGLEAEVALSGSLVRNLASQRVSAKLGYRQTGSHTVAPRGEPVEHYDYRLERGEWRCPIEVEITGLEPALPLFGAA
jgi:RimJ/RimL family protein N-acetyltransferase